MARPTRSLTERGWAVAGVGTALVVLWVALGERELLAAGAVLLLAVAGAWGWTAIGDRRVELVRRLSPTMVREGDVAAVDLRIRNASTTPLTSLTIHDQVRGIGAATFGAAWVPVGGTLDGSYRILCERRGVYPVGPAVATLGDPFGLAAATIEVGEADRLVVYPRVEPLSGFPSARGLDPTLTAARPEFVHRGGDDFFTLREYRHGDDLRRVHWPSSAKRDELMIKQFETPWQSQAVIVLDTRATAYENEEAFETAVRGAASVLHHLHESGLRTSLWIGGGLVGEDADAYGAGLEALAAVRPQPAADLRAIGLRIHRDARGGALVVTTGRPDEHLAAMTFLLARDFGTTVVLGVSSTPPSATAAGSGAVGAAIVEPGDAWAEAWRRAGRSLWSGAAP